MTIIPFPARAARRYGGPVVTEAMAFEDEQDDGVQALAARLVAGEETALEEVYDRWSALVHTYALRALRDAHDAEDVTQQVFVAAWRSRHTLTPSPSALPAWLVGIARHKVADARAARARDADRLAAVVSLPGGADQSADEDVAERLVVRQAVEDLPDPAPHHHVPRLLGGTQPRRDRREGRPAARHREEPRPPWPDEAPPAARGGAP